MQRKYDISFETLGGPIEVQKAAWITQRKESGSYITPKIFHTYLIAEHSPIRRMILAWRVKNLSRRAMTHLVRHVHTQPYVASSRPDNFPGHENDPTVDVLFDSNAEALIALARKRLCTRAFIDTREVVEQVKLQLMHSPDAYFVELGSVLVPNCVYRCGCPEPKQMRCTWWALWSAKQSAQDLIDIKERYALYNEDFLLRSKI